MRNSFLRTKELLFVLVTLCVVTCLYFPALKFDFVWDDKQLIVSNQWLQSGALTWEAISRPILDQTTYFRPLVFLMYFYEIKFFGINPKIFHLVNVSIFFCNVLLAYFLSREIFKRLKCEGLAWLVCMLYAVHPTLVESNVWIAGRFDLLTTTFIFSSLLIFLARDRSSWFNDLAIAACVLAGLLSKEMAIIAPGLIFFYALATRPQADNGEKICLFFRENRRLVVFLVAAVALYFGLRIIAVGEIYHLERAVQANVNRSVFLPLHTLLFYLHQIALPFFDINPRHDIALEVQKGYQNAAMYGVVCIFVIGLVILAIKNRVAGWLGLAALFSLSLVLNVIPMTIGENIGHERFLTAPLFFFLVFFVYSGERIYAKLPPRAVKKLVAASLVSAFVVGSVFTTQSVIPIWRSNYTLWSWMYQRTPDVDYVSTAYFLALLNDKKMDEFELEFDKLVRSGKNISPMQKVFYSTYLLDKKDPAATAHINAAINAVKAETVGENDPLASQRVTYGMLYLLYFDKALSLALVDGDLKGALESSLEADQWKPKTGSPDYAGLWSRLAYYYLLQDYQGVRSQYEKIKNVTQMGGKNMAHSYLDIVYQYCKKFDLKNESACEGKALQSLREINQ